MAKKPSKPVRAAPVAKVNGHMAVEMVDVASINFDPANVRRHDERNLTAIKGSLTRFKQQTPLVVDQDGIVRKGNGTLEAARELGWEQIAVVRTTLTGAEATAYSIADNRTGELSAWDDEALGKLLGSMDDDLRLVAGFDEGELEKMLAQTNPSFDPVGMDDQSRLDQKASIVCPKCGHEFVNE